MTRTIFSRNSLAALGSLVFASAMCVALVVARAARTGSLQYVFLIWNLILAWIPFVYAFIAHRLHKAQSPNYFLITGCASVWLLFFPNAPYLLTDLMHLRIQDNGLFWFDLIMLLWFAWTGFLLGFVSLFLMQRIVSDSLGRFAGWAFAAAALGLSSFGVYLGRFLRWNSWDVFRNPLGLFLDIYDRFRHPLAHIRTHAFWFLLALFLLCVYVTLASFVQLQYERQPSN